MNSAIAVQMFNDISRRSAKLAEGRGGGPIAALAGTAKKVADRMNAFFELKENAEAAEILSSAEKLAAEFERLKTESVNTGLTYLAGLALAMDEVCNISGDVALSPLGREIREKTAGMVPTQRILLIQDAIKARDGRVLSAFLHDGVPALLTGITSEDRARFKEQLHKTHAAHLHGSREAARDALDLVESALVQAQQIVKSTLAEPALIAESAKNQKRGAAAAALSV